MKDQPDLGSLSTAAAAKWGDAPAIIFDANGETLSFREFDERTDALAAGLRNAGIKPGDRVVLCAANIALFPLAWFAIVKAGAIMVPINIAYRFDDAHHLLEIAEPRLAFCDSDRAELMAALQAAVPSIERVVCPEPGGRVNWQSFDAFEQSGEGPGGLAPSRHEVTNIQFTSGTSGLPKGCMLTHRYWFELTNAVGRAVIALTPDDVMLTAQAFTYLDPQWAFILTLQTGARLIVLERFRPTLLWEKISQYEVTFFYCLAAMPLMLLSTPPRPAERAHRLRAIMCSGIPSDQHRELEDRFGVPWVEAYGTTETGSDIGVSWSDHRSMIGIPTIGKPLCHREARIVDEADEAVARGNVGELHLRGPGMMWGYWKNADATAAAFSNGWYRTGDLARQDENGFFYIAGRRKDMIRRAGENIAAAEVEAALQQHPTVVLSACIAVPDPVRGEEIKAFVVRSSPISALDLVTHLQARVAGFKIPRYWAFVDRLPMTPSERVAKPMLPRDIDGDVWDRTRTSSGG